MQRTTVESLPSTRLSSRAARPTSEPRQSHSRDPIGVCVPSFSFRHSGGNGSIGYISFRTSSRAPGSIKRRPCVVSARRRPSSIQRRTVPGLLPTRCAASATVSMNRSYARAPTELLGAHRAAHRQTARRAQRKGSPATIARNRPQIGPIQTQARGPASSRDSSPHRDSAPHSYRPTPPEREVGRSNRPGARWKCLQMGWFSRRAQERQRAGPAQWPKRWPKPRRVAARRGCAGCLPGAHRRRRRGRACGGPRAGRTRPGSSCFGVADPRPSTARDPA